MSDPVAPYVLDGRRIRLADDVFVYVERTLTTDASSSSGGAPRSYGVAPTGVSPSGDVLSAIGPGEAAWLGFEPIEKRRPVVVRVRIDRADPLDAVTGEPWADELSHEPRNYLLCPPDYLLAGVREGERHRAFGLGERRAGNDVLERITILAGAERRTSVTVELVTPGRFTRLTGVEAEPLDPESGYKGWRLP